MVRPWWRPRPGASPTTARRSRTTPARSPSACGRPPPAPVPTRRRPARAWATSRPTLSASRQAASTPSPARRATSRRSSWPSRPGWGRWARSSSCPRCGAATTGAGGAGCSSRSPERRCVAIAGALLMAVGNAVPRRRRGRQHAGAARVRGARGARLHGDRPGAGGPVRQPRLAPGAAVPRDPGRRVRRATRAWPPRRDRSRRCIRSCRSPARSTPSGAPSRAAGPRPPSTPWSCSPGWCARSWSRSPWPPGRGPCGPAGGGRAGAA